MGIMRCTAMWQGIIWKLLANRQDFRALRATQRHRVDATARAGISFCPMQTDDSFVVAVVTCKPMACNLAEVPNSQ